MIFSNLFSRYNSRHFNNVSAKNKDFAHTKNTKGITLVALVVTIIVLLILAGVTIMTLFGENGLITMAQKAKSETENAQANAMAGIDSLINEMNSILNEDGNSGGAGAATFDDGTTLSWEQLKLAENSEKYGYYADKITDTSIGNEAFDGVIVLTSITIPDGVTSIGNSAFLDCDCLTSVTIPDSVTSIGISAFSSCLALTSITIPDSVTSIGEHAFNGGNSLTEIKVDANNANYCSENGILYNKDKTKLIQYPRGKAGTSFTVPDSVTSIGRAAFDGSSITSVTITDSVTNVGQAAFWNCESLTSINYNGTQAQWTAITKGTNWKYNVPTTCVVHCSDGDIAIASAG